MPSVYIGLTIITAAVAAYVFVRVSRYAHYEIAFACTALSVGLFTVKWSLDVAPPALAPPGLQQFFALPLAFQTYSGLSGIFLLTFGASIALVTFVGFRGRRQWKREFHDGMPPAAVSQREAP